MRLVHKFSLTSTKHFTLKPRVSNIYEQLIYFGLLLVAILPTNVFNDNRNRKIEYWISRKLNIGQNLIGHPTFIKSIDIVMIGL